MKRMKKIVGYIMVFSLLCTTGCEDFLEREPVSITYPNVYWVNQSNADQALAGAYGLFKYAISGQANFIYWGEITGMTFMRSRNWICNYIQNSGNYVLAYRDGSRNWKDLYRAANWANTIELYVNDMPDEVFSSVEDKNRIIGEAAFIRAISYFYLTRLWGDVPIVEESIETSDQLITEDGYIVRIPRSSEKEVLDYTLEAVDKAISLLDYSTPEDSKWAITANKASAEALKAHVTLWYASRDNDNNEMMQKCINAATSVINNSNAELIDYVVEGADGVEDMCKGQSKTGLFEINFNAGMNESFRMSSGDDRHMGLTQNYPVFKNYNGSGPLIDPEYYGKEFMTADPDRDNDVRKEHFFYLYDNPDDSFISKYQYQSADPNSEDPYAQFTESNILIFRLADMYLLRAEANAKLGNDGPAVADMNIIRSKASVPAYTGATDRASLMKAIFDERAIEFVGEAQGGFDRIRMDYYYEGVPWMNQNRISKKGYFWPIHPSVISVNPSIVQTEYWRGKL
ncbi:MAG: RagB/SusD family nutrient uptake outer membrane protein [Marinilabiliaceae bacterium]|nr:RagB/SusD family nutrient uptake outer membrane protein [Marinilabiliaceae bacterium]